MSSTDKRLKTLLSLTWSRTSPPPTDPILGEMQITVAAMAATTSKLKRQTSCITDQETSRKMSIESKVKPIRREADKAKTQAAWARITRSKTCWLTLRASLKVWIHVIKAMLTTITFMVVWIPYLKSQLVMQLLNMRSRTTLEILITTTITPSKMVLLKKKILSVSWTKRNSVTLH